MFTVAKSQKRCWEVFNNDKTVSARLYSWRKNDVESQEELEALASFFSPVPSAQQGVHLTAYGVSARARLGGWLVRFGWWLASNGGR